MGAGRSLWDIYISDFSVKLSPISFASTLPLRHPTPYNYPSINPVPNNKQVQKCTATAMNLELLTFSGK
jgi:hypothetical protein